jgi:1-acyl-sn-glycerol-3-phosphate acyltransferase
LEAGRTVVIYPEGTRSTDGQVGEFHSGAVRLAADCGAALVPVAVLGTRDVLPKHGQVRRAPMEVRIGVPRAAEETDAAQLRSDVLALLDKGPAWARPTMRQADRGDARRARAHRWLDCDRAGGLRRRELRAAWFGPVIAIIRTRRGCERL